MNASSWLKRTATSSKVARLDSELILAEAIGKDRVFLYAHPEFELSEAQEQRADEMLAQRENHQSLAYILGRKEFYGREFTVNSDVLVPRPESEVFIELAKELKPRMILDVGTGSGCLAITLKLEIPAAEVVALDISPKALEIAKANAKKLGADVEFHESDLLSAVKDEKFDLIVANLPYVDKNWDWLSPELQFEPDLALYAGKEGLELIEKLVDSVEPNLEKDGKLMLESDLSQHEAIKAYVEQHTSLKLQKTSGLIQLFA